MTRINCVDVAELSGQHLVAEYRELPRVFNLARNACKKGPLPHLEQYVLGPGHVRFFYTRVGYLRRRHHELINEMRRRGYRPQFDGIRREAFPEIPDEYWADWIPTKEAIRLNRERIAQRSSTGNAVTAVVTV